jgi:queuine tRNA-ribosyltransferase
MEVPIRFTILKHQRGTRARAGVIHTPHGDIHTPAFLPVGTKGTVKSLKPEDLDLYVEHQAQLANTYHLYLQPGHDVIAAAGGIHSFAHWNKPTMTDSGGFQVFSLGAAYKQGVTKFATQPEPEVPESLVVYNEELASSHGKLCVIDEDGVTFTSHLDGSLHRFTAERSIEIQHAIGADIIVAFDECTSPTAAYEYQREAMERTHRWAKRSLLHHMRNHAALSRQGLYGVIQGGRYLDLRAESARVLGAMDFAGYGIGGSFTKVDLGEPLSVVTDQLPAEKPRHLLGIGEPEDIVAGVANGCDTFDCVMPTRIARTGMIYVHHGSSLGKINLRRSEYRTDFSKPDPLCSCYVCTHYTRAYLAHLFHSQEMLGPHLATIHNLHILINFTNQLRNRILES